MLDNIDGLDDLLAERAAMDAKIADAAKAADDKLRNQQTAALKAHDDALRTAEIARRARQQRYDDLQAKRDHEAEQLAFVLRGTDIPSSPQPPAAPATPPQPPVQPLAPQPPVTPPPVQDDDTTPLPGGIRFDDQRPRATPPADVPPAPRRQSGFDPRGRSRLWLVLAAVGLVIGFLVGYFTMGPVWGHIGNAAVRVIFKVLWVVALSAAGFFTGGHIGTKIEERKQNGNTRQH